jgi:hypothetical protein
VRQANSATELGMIARSAGRVTACSQPDEGHPSSLVATKPPA